MERDRAAVRHICFITGYMGDPVDWIWRDAESFADLWSSYYTDREPESALVAERGVVGYLLGCRDTVRPGNPVGPLAGMRSPTGDRHHSQWMVQDLGAPGSDA